MKKFLLLIISIFLIFNNVGSAQNKDQSISYTLVSNHVMEEICTTKFGCASTVKKEFLSNDGFLFEVYTTNKTDAVWCLPYTNDNKPCSTIGDTGAGKNEMTIHDVKNNKKIKIINDSHSGRITRLNTSKEFMYIIMEIYSGGASCCSITELYSKQDISLKPFVIDEKMGNFSIDENINLVNSHFEKQ